MASKKKIDKTNKCERCKRQKAEFLVTELVLTKQHKPAPFKACASCARKALNLAGKIATRL